MRTILFAVLLSIGSASAGQAPTHEKQKQTPELEMKDLHGRTVRLANFKGKVVLLNFWATWCAPCRAEIPELVKLQATYKARGLQIAAVTYPPYRFSRVKSVARQFGISYPVLFGSRQAAASYDVGEVLPVSVIIDREGRIRDRIVGVIDREEFDLKVRPLLEKPK